ncbi:hypothetical protein BOW53_12290 [Solemya pervernicosa gill symbiont]|uniref:Uncharacterized protein n=2 Tax=Gammaproteobacteria incertae sedis TaxID=118884 RepID=A0A1T2L2B4_9GAMM|nr:hypothetical protein BOW53_12290 [Solemya pervernicosa gill symbiont]
MNCQIEAAGSADLTFRDTSVVLTLEELELPESEQMGLAGISYLFRPEPWFYVGGSAYGAATGERGGFFTGGLTAGLQSDPERLISLDGGLFVGGGGGSAPQGGGLMIRPHLGISLNSGIGSVGLQYSVVQFPNGDIESSQFALSLSQPTSLLLGKGWLDEDRFFWAFRNLDSERRLAPHSRRFLATLKYYQPPEGTVGAAGSLKEDGHAVVGFEWNRDYDSGFFYRLESSGAAGGTSDGFAEILFGGGYGISLADRTRLKLAVGFGAAGGGDVETGGGIIADSYLGFEHQFQSGISIGARAGYLIAPDGDFEALTSALQLGYSFDAPDITPAGGTLVARDEYAPQFMRVRFMHQSYLPEEGMRRKGGAVDDRRVDLIGAKFDYMLNRHVYLTGQAISAYAGGAGGYAVGLLGAGVTRPFWRHSRLQWNAELTVGAAGGGGLPVGGGYIVQPMAGIEYLLTPNMGVALNGGLIWAPEGELTAGLVEFGINYRFSTVERQ